MASVATPRRHWRSYGNDPLPTAAEALDESFSAFPSWFLRITCDRCGKERTVAQVHFTRADLSLRVILGKMRHDGCGGLVGNAELISSVEGVSSRPVRKIVLITHPMLTAAPLRRRRSSTFWGWRWREVRSLGDRPMLAQVSAPTCLTSSRPAACRVVRWSDGFSAVS